MHVPEEIMRAAKGQHPEVEACIHKLSAWIDVGGDIDASDPHGTPLLLSLIHISEPTRRS
eukprot:2797320-Prymnesium_polylepis.1